jgi:hypothetical protein
MTDLPALLSPVLLAELEARWRRQGAPIASCLRDGRPQNSYDEAFAEYGLAVPDEVRTWWSWHDSAEASMPQSTVLLGTGWVFFSLERARRELKEQRERAATISPSDPSLLWDAAWLPLSTDAHGGVLLVDGTTNLAGPTPVYYTEPESGGRTRSVPAPSFGTLVGWWIDALDRGAGWDSTENRWRYDDYAIDPEVAATGMVELPRLRREAAGLSAR